MLNLLSMQIFFQCKMQNAQLHRLENLGHLEKLELHAISEDEASLVTT